MADPQVLVKLIEGCIVKLFTIVSDDDTKKSKVANYQPPNKLLGLLFSDPS